MLALVEDVVTLLQADATLTGLGVVVRDEWIEADDDEVFYVDPNDAANLVQMWPTLAVLAGGEALTPGGETVGGVFRRVNVHSFFPSGPGGRDMFDAMDDRVMATVHGAEVALPDGRPAVLIADRDATAPIPLEGFPGAMTSRRGFVGEFLRG